MGIEAVNALDYQLPDSHTAVAAARGRYRSWLCALLAAASVASQTGCASLSQAPTNLSKMPFICTPVVCNIIDPVASGY